MSNNFYHGSRWMGLWNNPNIYGMLMGAGVTLAVGLLAAGRIADGKWQMANNCEKRKAESEKAETEIQQKHSSRRAPQVFLLIAVFMMGVGLVCSYSRGAWLGTTIGLLYLAKAYGKFKWRYLLPMVFIAIAVVCFFWNTPRTAPWYFQRLDMSRGSVQHRVAAWRGALHMMWDHPLGVGWGKAEEVYRECYSPPENGAAAITTNDYLMLGTQLGWPGLVCFVTYVALCLRTKLKRHLTPALSPFDPSAPVKRGEGELSAAQQQAASLVTRHLPPDASLRVACRAGAVTMLVGFWFDGGLFTLATGAVFWVLLELGVEPRNTRIT